VASPAPLVRPREGIIDAVRAAIGSAFLSARDEVDEVSIDVRRESIADVLRTLRDSLDYQQLMEIAGVDYPERAERFEIVYHLLSITRNHRLRIRVSTDEERPVPTVTTASAAIRSARTSRSPAMSSCAIPRSRSASSTSPSRSPRISAISTS
jgi:NADH-quinone oxidoreductase subunit C